MDDHLSVGMTGIAPAASCSPNTRSTPELHPESWKTGDSNPDPSRGPHLYSKQGRQPVSLRLPKRSSGGRRRTRTRSLVERSALCSKQAWHLATSPSISRRHPRASCFADAIAVEIIALGRSGGSRTPRSFAPTNGSRAELERAIVASPEALRRAELALARGVEPLRSGSSIVDGSSDRRCGPHPRGASW